MSIEINGIVQVSVRFARCWKGAWSCMRQSLEMLLCCAPWEFKTWFGWILSNPLLIVVRCIKTQTEDLLLLKNRTREKEKRNKYKKTDQTTPNESKHRQDKEMKHLCPCCRQSFTWSAHFRLRHDWSWCSRDSAVAVVAVHCRACIRLWKAKLDFFVNLSAPTSICRGNDDVLSGSELLLRCSGTAAKNGIMFWCTSLPFSLFVGDEEKRKHESVWKGKRNCRAGRCCT